MDLSINVERFLNPQQSAYQEALTEICQGKKRSHWMWFVFPQLRGLGSSTTAWYYGIENLEEAKKYLSHPVLGQRLREITGALLTLQTQNPEEIFGWTDSMKLHSSMTLFYRASGEDLFAQVLRKYYGGTQDPITLKLLHLE